MCINPKRKAELLESGMIIGNETCAMCDKDVRSYEIANRVSVKVRTELVEHSQ